MAKAEWGAKHLCPSCGARFYDLQRKAIACPKCGAPYRAEAPAKPRRNAPAETAPAEAAPAKAAPDMADKPDAPVAAENGKLETFDDSEDNRAAENIIEDASELGEDEDDVAEVVDDSRQGDEA